MADIVKAHNCLTIDPSEVWSVAPLLNHNTYI